MSTRRWIRRLLAGGAFGAGLTVAIAWYFAIASATGPKGAVRSVGLVKSAADELIGVFDEPRGVGFHLRLASSVDPHLAERARAGGAQSTPVVSRPDWLPTNFGATDTLREEHVGWPMLALKSGYGTRTPPGRLSRDVHLPAMSFPTRSTTYTLPLSPIWRGFVVNAALFGTLYVGMAMAVQRLRRVQAGRCGQCRYNLGGLPGGAVCPECGTPQGDAVGITGA